MRLKSLKLAGFKSFANVTTFNFPKGITAIVGPNGCGKSNVIDAIRWVLGETSAKQLRGGAMSDVIFAGTESRVAKSVASVELTFEHTQDEHTGIRHELNLYHELSVRRQVNKEGRSDYFINGTRCRRRDVVDIFLGTGLGARSYAVIEQGMIGRIVDSSPLQLREFIEEAAGVSRYQVRREETYKKLEQTRDNLARLHDIQSELTQQQKRLGKQAESAKTHAALTLEQSELAQALSIQALYRAKQTQMTQKAQKSQSEAAASEQQQAFTLLKQKQDTISARINEAQWLKDEAQSSFYEEKLAHQQSEHQRNELAAQLSQIDEQITQIERQRERLDADIERLEAETGAQAQSLSELRPQLTEITEKRARYESSSAPLQAAWDEAKQTLHQLEERLRTLEQQRAIEREAQKRLERSEHKWTQQQESWQNRFAQHQAQSEGQHTEDSAKSLKDSRAHIDTLNAQQQALQEQIQDAEPQAAKLQAALDELTRAHSNDEKRHATLAGEYDALHRILHPAPTKNAPSQANSTTNSVTPYAVEAYIQTLREHIELTAAGQAHAATLDTWLAMLLDTHVLDSKALSADASLSALLWQYQQGVETDSSDNNSKHNKNSAQDKKSAAHIGLWLPAQQATTATENLPPDVFAVRELIKAPALSIFQHCYLYAPADDSDSRTLSNILAKLPPHALLLTTDGWLVSTHGTWHLRKLMGNTDTSSAFLSERLAQRNRLTELEDALDTLEAAMDTRSKTIKAQTRDHDAIKINLEELQAQSQRLTQDIHRAEQAYSARSAAFERNQSAAQRLDADKALLDNEKKELDDERQAITDSLGTLQASINALTPKLHAARAACDSHQAERQAMSQARRADDDAYQGLQLNIQQQEIRHEHSSSSLVQAKERHYQAGRKAQTLLTRQKRYQQQLPELTANCERTQSAKDAKSVLLAEREQELSTLKADYSTRQAALDAASELLQAKQHAAAEAATALALSNQRLEDARAHTEAAIAAYQKHSGSSQSQHVGSLLSDFIAHPHRLSEDKTAELTAHYDAVTRKLSRIGAVNLAAAAELADVEARLEPLAAQTTDIRQSIETLSSAISAIDETTKSLFMQTLSAVNAELERLFAKVFGGGKASLSLNIDELPAGTPKAEHWRAGLTLMAQPKGKRNSRLAVLSGGEKTLTALSLIFAIFKQHPAPFCVLDEVDAPLDDANVTRFTSLIHELADEVQFVFISHNKLAMQIADELKGITMPTAGISTLVSVSLDEAAQYIES
ncbi:chromosome segregation protein SMC [Psychrobacter aestuarii]|uniref:Chromosome partition protein Smc n=1 Tax=Psychrobacter aestuarii TaxID=556327 RepID=A0ABN0VKL9_9GAMM|nr:chromosome segregation protein SMC [Psychrobacter aestuarii]